MSEAANATEASYQVVKRSLADRRPAGLWKEHEKDVHEYQARTPKFAISPDLDFGERCFYIFQSSERRTYGPNDIRLVEICVSLSKSLVACQPARR